MSVAAPQPRPNQGAPEPRIEARLKVTGEARYPADIPVNDLAYGVLVTSSIARGRAQAVRVDAAKAVPGILAVFTYGDMDELAKPKFGNSGMTSVQPLQERDIRHDGQIVALVVADTFEAAEEAAHRIAADYVED